MGQWKPGAERRQQAQSLPGNRDDVSQTGLFPTWLYHKYCKASPPFHGTGIYNRFLFLDK